ncbi:MAG TPA: two-component regulator propeller domain-containing protein [Thermoanaerobaculia bacterium]|nr:two-component regulator propeller domain-containing protein [Thermoanaerobaculia bacterium]
MVRTLLAVFFALGALAGGRAGLVSFRRLPIPDDVPAHLCSAIAQDARGFLWFGTQGGLVRYDGYEWRVFRSNAADPSTLGGNYVRALLPSRDGGLWVGTFSGGLSRFDPKTETFTRYPVGYGRVEGLAEDARGRVWIATSAGLERLDPKTRRMERFRLTDDRVRGLLIDRAGTLGVGTRDGLHRWLGEGRGFVRVAPELPPGLAEKLRAAVAGHPFPLPDGPLLRRTCSIGYAAWPLGHLTWEQVIDRADAALYAAKRGGRDACVGAETLVA